MTEAGGKTWGIQPSARLRSLAQAQTRAEDQLAKDRIKARLFATPQAAARIGRYTVLEELGAGAMGVVYAAYDGELDRKVALKLLRAEVGSASYALRFKREARALARLAHPNVVAVHEVDTWEGRPFLAMEFVKGQTLHTWQHAGPRPWSAVLRAYLAAGQGMAAVHREGVVHRDFKPDNVLMGDDGRVRVADFGLAQIAGQSAKLAQQPGVAPRLLQRGTVTDASAAAGTPAYMAPEQLLGDPVDAQADQFSFCVALYEGLCGHRPFAGDDLAAVMDAVQAGRIAAPPVSSQVPPRVWRVLARGLAARPAERWPDMEALLEALARAAWPARPWRWRLAFLGLVALGASAALVAHWALARSHARRQALAAELSDQRALAEDARLVSAASQLMEHDPTAAARALAEVRYPGRAAGWLPVATAVLQQPLSQAAIEARDMAIGKFAVSPDTLHIAAWTLDGQIRVWRADGTGGPVDLALPRVRPTLWGRSVAFSPDGRALLVHTASGALLVYPLGGEPTPQAFAGGATEVLAAQWSADGRGVQLLLLDGTTGLWQPGEPLIPGRRIADVPAEVGWARFSRDGTRLVCRLPGSALRFAVWSLEDRRPPVILSGAARVAGRQLWVISPDGRHLAAGTPDLAGPREREVWLWGVDAPSSPMRLGGHTGRIRDMAFSPDGRRLLTASDDVAVRIWRVDDGKQLMVLHGHTGPIYSAAFSPDGQRVVTASGDRTARVWELSERGRVWILRGHRFMLGAAEFTSSGEQVVTFSEDGTMRVWGLPRQHSIRLRGHEERIWSASFDPGGTRLVTAAHDGTARIWDLTGANQPVVLRGHTGRRVYSAVFSPDGSLVATGGDDGTARIWRRDGTPVAVLDGHEDWAYSVSFSPDGQELFTGSRMGQIRQWRWDAAGAVRLSAQTRGDVRTDVIGSLAPTPDGTGTMACTSGGDLLVWRPDSQREPARVRVGDRHCTASYSPDGTRLAIGTGDGTVQLRDASTMAVLREQRAHSFRIERVAFSPDGRRLATASLDGTARVWDRDLAGAPVVLYGHEDWVTDVAFDATGEWLITASRDHSARIWNLADPENPIVLRGHTGGLRFAAFASDGRVITAARDGTARIWMIDLAAEASALHAQLGRATTTCLSVDQRRQFLHEDDATASARTGACERAHGRMP